MADLPQYVRDAVRTESRIDTVTTDKALLLGTIGAFIAIGNVLDMIKKNVFYGKEIDTETLCDWWDRAADSFDLIMEHQDDPEDPTLIPEIILEGEIDTRMFHAMLGIATESTELLEALLSYIQGGDLDFVNVCEELGDVNWYQAIAVDTMEADFDKIFSVNIDKLRARFPEKFTEEKAIERDLGTERQILEDGNETI